MYRTITTIIFTVIVVLFSVQNFDHVPVDIFYGNPIHIRLIFVIAISGVIGYLIRHFIGIEREERLKRQLRLLARKKQGFGGGRRAPGPDRSEIDFDHR